MLQTAELTRFDLRDDEIFGPFVRAAVQARGESADGSRYVQYEIGFTADSHLRLIVFDNAPNSSTRVSDSDADAPELKDYYEIYDDARNERTQETESCLQIVSGTNLVALCD